MYYEAAFVIGMFAVSFYLLKLADSFKLEGEETYSHALLNGSLTLLLRLISAASLLFNIFFMNLMLQDQTQTTAMQGIETVYGGYLTMFIYSFGLLFFLIFFIQQFVLFAENMKIHKTNKKMERQY